MSTPLRCDEELLRRIPLPLAQLYRRAVNAKTAVERHLTAFSLWEAGLKLLASAAVVTYARKPEDRPDLAERLKALARPSLGHWWDIGRSLLPVLADRSEAGYPAVRDALLGRGRSDLPRAAGLDAALRTALGQPGEARAVIKIADLLDHLIAYRNKVLGHGSPGRLGDDVHERMASACLLGVAEVLGKVDLLAGRQLLHVGEVRQVGGEWLVQRYELIGESPRRLPALELPRDAAGQLPDGDRVYLSDPARPDDASALTLLHPLVLFDAEGYRVLFLNSRRGKRGTEYLCYGSGETVERPSMGSEQRELLAKALGLAVGESDAEAWAEKSRAEDPEGAPAPCSERRIGEYELLSELGRGGMGVVYRAWQPSLGRQVALKKLLQAGDARADARFRREVRALGRVDHSHLVKVYTSGADGEHFYYTMELVEGAPLSAVSDRLSTQQATASEVDLRLWRQVLSSVHGEARLAEKPLTEAPSAAPNHPTTTGGGLTTSRDWVRHLVGLIQQVAEAAHALHEAGVIHRDIKPGNILVTPDGSQAVLMDLGLAQMADDAEGRLTRTRQFVGTLRYASPEQVLAVGGVDRRSDVYSLGASLWELLTLRPLYGADEETPPPELMRRIQYQEPERLRQHHPGVPRDLDAIVLKCLEKDPARRYATAGELAEELRCFLSGEPVRARPVSRLDRGWRWCRRNRALAGLWLMLGLLLLGGSAAVGYAAFQSAAQEELADAAEREKEQREEAEEARAEAEKAKGRAEGSEQEALQQKKRADEEALKAEWLLYASQITRGQHEWERGNVGRMREVLDSTRPDFRGWEHQYLYGLAHRPEQTLFWLISGGEGLAFSPDGRRIASGDWNGNVKVWDAMKGLEAFTLRGHKWGVTSVAFSPDGKRIASGSKDGTVTLWDAQTGEEGFTLRGDTDGITSVAFSPDGKNIASGCANGKVNVWHAQSGQRTRTLVGHTNMVLSVAFSPDGNHIASGHNDGTVKVWEGQTGREVRTITGNPSNLIRATFSPDGKRLATWSKDVTLWDARSGQVIHTLQGHGGRINCVAFSPDGQRIASGGYDETVKLWDAQTGQEIHRLYTGSVVGLAYSPDGRRIATASVGTIQVWQVDEQDNAHTLQGHKIVTFSPDGRRFASISDHGTSVKVWDAQSRQEVHTLRGHTGTVFGVAFSRDGRRIATGGDDCTVKIWDTQRGQEVLTCKGHTGRVRGVTFSPNGQHIASCGAADIPERDHDGGEVKVWDAQTGRELLTIAAHYFEANAIAYSSDGQRIASVANFPTGNAFFYGGRMSVWDAQTGKNIYGVKGRSGFMDTVAFSPDGQRIATGGGDEVRVWDAQTGQDVHTLRVIGSIIIGVAFSPDGRRIASAVESSTGEAIAAVSVKVWDAKSGLELYTLKGGGGSVTFSPDGRSIASGGMVWDAQTGPGVSTLRGHTSEVAEVAYSPDGKRIFSRDASDRVIVWDAASRKPLPDPRTELPPFSLPWARSADGKWLAVGHGEFVRVFPLGINAGRAERLTSMAAFNPAWHREQARQTEQSGNGFGAAFHLGILLQHEPWDAELHLRRAYALAQFERTPAAVAHALAAVMLDPRARWQPPAVEPRMPRVPEGP